MATDFDLCLILSRFEDNWVLTMIKITGAETRKIIWRWVKPISASLTWLFFLSRFSLFNKFNFLDNHLSNLQIKVWSHPWNTSSTVPLVLFHRLRDPFTFQTLFSTIQIFLKDHVWSLVIPFFLLNHVTGVRKHFKLTKVWLLVIKHGFYPKKKICEHCEMNRFALTTALWLDKIDSRLKIDSIHF